MANQRIFAIIWLGNLPDTKYPISGERIDGLRQRKSAVLAGCSIAAARAVAIGLRISMIHSASPICGSHPVYREFLGALVPDLARGR